MFNDEYYMKEALKQAHQAFSEDEIPIGAIIVCQNRIIARAHNQTERLNDVTAHAEMLALTAAFEAIGGKHLNECTLYVTVEPCPMCAGATYWAQLGKIVYGAGDEKRGFLKIGKNILHPKTILESGVLAIDCSRLMTDFFLNKRD